MYFISTNPDLSPKPKPHPVRHPSARVPEHARAIHTVKKAICNRFARGQDCVGVVRGVGVYMRGREVHSCIRRGGARDSFDGEYEVEELGAVVCVGRMLEDRSLGVGEVMRECGMGCGVAAEGNAFLEQGGRHFRKDGF